MVPQFKANRSLTASNAVIRLKIGLLAALLAIVPVAAIGVTTYVIAARSLAQEVNKYNLMAMKQVQRRIDDMMSMIDRTVMQHVMDESRNVQLREGTLLDNDLERSRLLTALASMETALEYVDAVYLYSRVNDALVTVNGIERNPEQLLGAALVDQLEANRQPVVWLDRLSAPAGETNDNEIVGLVFARRVPASLADPLAYFVVLVREEALFDKSEFASFGFREGGMLAVSPEGNMYADEATLDILRAGYPVEAFAGWLRTAFDEQAGNVASVQPIGSREWMLHGVQSEESGWTYLSLLPLSELTQRVRSVQRVVLLACAGLAATILLLLLLLSANVHARVQRMLERLRSDRRALEHQVKEAAPERQAYWIQHWLNEACTSEDQERLRRLGIPVEAQTFAALCMEWEADAVDRGSRSVELIAYVQQQQPKQARLFWTRLGLDRVGAVLIGQADADAAIAFAQLESWVGQLMERIQGELGLTVYAAFGGVRAEAAAVHESFDEAQRALRQRLVYPERRLFTSQDIVQAQSPLLYPHEQEKLILAHMKLGEADKAAQFLRDFIKQLLQASELDEQRVKQSLAMLLSAMLRLSADERESSGAYGQLQRLQSIPEIEAWFCTNIIVAISGQAAKMKRSDAEGTEGTDGLVQKAIRYVRHHYDENLSLHILADLMNTSEPALSVMFKRETGLTFTDYVLSVRMEKAKEWLSSTDMKIVDIAERLQYNNSQNFIRAFKRVAGLTPGEYRKMQGG